VLDSALHEMLDGSKDVRVPLSHPKCLWLLGNPIQKSRLLWVFLAERVGPQHCVRLWVDEELRPFEWVCRYRWGHGWVRDGSSRVGAVVGLNGGMFAPATAASCASCQKRR